MATESRPTTAATSSETSTRSAAQPKRFRSIFEVPAEFLDACRILSPSASLLSDTSEKSVSIPPLVETTDEADVKEENVLKNGVAAPRWTCNTCKSEFESLLDQRSHFKSDIHRINVKLSVAGKAIVNEDDFDELTSDSFKDCDISSISGSEDEAEKASLLRNDMQKGLSESSKLKVYVQLQTGERVSVWRSLILNESEIVRYESDRGSFVDNPGCARSLSEKVVIERLKFLIHEGRDGSHLRIVLLVSGGHFAGCVFDGSSVVAHKTFHRYVVRAKAGKKQSSKDAGGRAAHSAGASLRRYNEIALKKDIQELLAAWKPYFDASSCVFVYAPSSNRQMLFDGDRAYFSYQHCTIRNIPVNVRRPTLKEARRIYNQLTQVTYEVDEEKILPHVEDNLLLSLSTVIDSKSDSSGKNPDNYTETAEASSSQKASDEQFLASDNDTEVVQRTTPLHEAAKSGNADKVLELLERGMDPCIKDARGRTPYMLANEKEARNTFRRFMASNIDMWDWHAANVPSALTKEMEESQAAKQAEKDAKKKARAKELKKLRKAREKKSQIFAQETADQNARALAQNGSTASSVKGKAQPIGKSSMSSEEQQKRALDIEREKRAAAAERRMAAAASLNAQGSGSSPVPSTAQASGVLQGDVTCYCCNASLAGKIPFHRYNYKYCSTSCMHVHRELLEEG